MSARLAAAWDRLTSAARRIAGIPQVEEEYGDVVGLYVQVLRDQEGRRFVAFGMRRDPDRERYTIDDRQAVQLARFLRLAALPGNSLADARYKRRQAERMHW